MYEKVATFALLCAAAYAQTDSTTSSAYDTPAPGPVFPDYTLFTQVDQPSAKDIGSFPLLIDYLGFALWEDSDKSGDLKSWNANSTWTGLDKYAPDGEVFGAIINFSSVPPKDDFAVVGVYCEGDPKSWIAYGDTDPSKDGTYNDDPSNVPSSNGVTDKFDPSSLTEVKAEGNFEGLSGGLDDEFGQYWDDPSKSWVIWNYNSGVDDWVAGNYTAWAG